MALKTCPSARHTASSPEADSITVGIQYAPLSFYMYDDTLGGLDYDLFRLISQQNGVSFRFKPITTEQEGLSGLSEGRYDIVAADYPVTAEMRNDYLFTEPAYIDRQVLVQMKDPADSSSLITSVLDLRDDTVYIPQGSPVASRIQHLGEELGDTIHIRKITSSPEQLFIKVAIGEIPYAVINEQTAKALLPDYPQMEIATSISFSQFQPWILSKGHKALCDSVNQWIQAAKSTSAYDQIINRYVK